MIMKKIKYIKQIIKEEMQSVLAERGIITEKFGSQKISSVYSGLPGWGQQKSFFGHMAKQFGFKWDQVTDDMVKGPTSRLTKKGVEFIIATKDDSVRPSSRWAGETRIQKGSLLGVSINGKRAWLGGAMVKTGQGSRWSNIGLDARGFNKLDQLLRLAGAQVYQIDPEEVGRGAVEDRASRADAKAGATAMMDARKVKEQNKTRYRTALQNKAKAEGSGPLIKMIDEVTKLFESVLTEKINQLKKGNILENEWNSRWQKISRAHSSMVQSFEQYIKYGSAAEKASKDKTDDTNWGSNYYGKSMAEEALRLKSDYKNLMIVLSKLGKVDKYKKADY